MNLSWLPAGSRKYTLLPLPLAPMRTTGALFDQDAVLPQVRDGTLDGASIRSTDRCFPGDAGIRPTGCGDRPGPWTFSCSVPSLYGHVPPPRSTSSPPSTSV